VDKPLKSVTHGQCDARPTVTFPAAEHHRPLAGTHLTDPRRDGRLSRPCWRTDSGRFTHKEVTRPAASLAQNRESTPAEPAVLTTMLRHQLSVVCNNEISKHGHIQCINCA